jgi:hypothetical protein
MTTSGSEPAWLYEADEQPKRKHRWKESHAGFVLESGEKVGKCPAGMSTAQAQILINTQSVPFFNPKAPGPYPDRLYVVHEGVVYRATPTRPGVSFHAFPETAERLSRLPGKWKDQILELADRLGCRKGVLDWMSG